MNRPARLVRRARLPRATNTRLAIHDAAECTRLALRASAGRFTNRPYGTGDEPWIEKPPYDDDQALVLASGMAGAVLLARAVDDPELSDRILSACRAFYTAALATSPGTRDHEND